MDTLDIIVCFVLGLVALWAIVDIFFEKIEKFCRDGK